MLFRVCNKYSVASIFLMFIFPIIGLAALKDDVVEQADRANEIKSAVREKKGTWLPVPIPVSNPTIGTGLQVALLYLHPQTSEDPTVPSATSGVLGMYTDSDSWLAGAFHDGNYKNDLYRYRVVAGTGEFNLDYYGVGGDPNVRTPFNAKSDIAMGQFLRRIPGTKNFYLGLRYLYTESNVTFDFSNSIPDLPPVSDGMTTSGLGVLFNYDSRDNNYYPTSGSYSEFLWIRDKESIGSDFDFDKLDIFSNYYMPVSSKSTLAFRATLANANGNIPFYMLPTLKLRGFAVGKYQDKSSFSGHIEWRHKFLPRWGVIAFYEAGSVAKTVNKLLQADLINSVGTGIRWQVTEDKKLNLGIDIGYSDGDSAVYVKVGEHF